MATVLFQYHHQIHKMQCKFVLFKKYISTFYSKWVLQGASPAHLCTPHKFSLPLESKLLPSGFTSWKAHRLLWLLNETPNLYRRPVSFQIPKTLIFAIHLFLKLQWVFSRVLLQNVDMLKYRITELAGPLEKAYFTKEETETQYHTITLVAKSKPWVSNRSLYTSPPF